MLSDIEFAFDITPFITQKPFNFILQQKKAKQTNKNLVWKKEINAYISLISIKYSQRYFAISSALWLGTFVVKYFSVTYHEVVIRK
jgi:hypothetical protein